MLHYDQPITCLCRHRGGRIVPTHLQLFDTRKWVVNTMLRPLYPQERSDTHCTGGWVSPVAGLDGT